MEQSQLTGRIELERVRDARPIRSFITKKLLAWLDGHGIGPTERRSYQIALNKTSHGHWFTCRIHIHTEDSDWEALVTESDLHQSILSALNHLAPQRRVHASA